MENFAARTHADEEALRCALDRAGYAFACLFSNSAEFEADIIRERRAAGTYQSQASRLAWLRVGASLVILVLLFLMI